MLNELNNNDVNKNNKALSVAKNQDLKQKKQRKSFFSKLKYQLKQASIEKKMGNFTDKRAKTLATMEDDFFKSFLDGEVSVKRLSKKMRYVLYKGYNRMNRRNYKLALQGKMTFTKAAQIAIPAIRKIEGGLTRTSLVNILVRFFRFIEVTNTSDTIDELFMYSDDNHVYQPASNALDRKVYDIYTDFGSGLLRLHSIIRLLEVNKYTKHIDIDDIKHNPSRVVCNNGIYDRKTNRFLKFSPNYFITNKLNANYPSKAFLKKIKHTTVRQAISYGGTDKNLGANNKLLAMTIPKFMHYFFDMITSFDSSMKHQLFQEILDAIEPHYSHEAIVFNYGKSHTGKSEFMMLIRGIIGKSKYASMSVNQLQQKSALSTAVGKFAVLGDDLSGQIDIKDDSNILKMARGANIYTEAKYKQGHTSTLKGAIINNINKFPKTASKGPWVSNRIFVVLFRHQFIKNKDDEDYKKNPYYFSDDWIKTLFGTPFVDSYILYLTLHQPRFSRYLMTENSKHMIRVFANQNNPVQLFCNRVMQAPKNRLVKKTVYQQFVEFSHEYGFNKKYQNMSFSDFDSTFKTYMPKCVTSQERMDNTQIANQELITQQFHLRIGRKNSQGKIVQYYIQPLSSGRRYTCYVFPSIPNDIIDYNIDGIVSSIVPGDNIVFPKANWFKPGEHDADVKVLRQFNLLPKGIDGVTLSQFMIEVNAKGYAKACKNYGFNAKKYYLKMLGVAAYVRAAHKSYVTLSAESDDSAWNHLQYEIHKGLKRDQEDKKAVKDNRKDTAEIKEELLDKKIAKQVMANNQKKHKAKQSAKIHVKIEPKAYTSAHGDYVTDANKIDWFILNKVKDLKPETYIIEVDYTKHGVIAKTNKGLNLKLRADNRKIFDKAMKSITNGDVKNGRHQGKQTH